MPFYFGKIIITSLTAVGLVAVCEISTNIFRSFRKSYFPENLIFRISRNKTNRGDQIFEVFKNLIFRIKIIFQNKECSITRGHSLRLDIRKYMPSKGRLHFTYNFLL